MMQQFLLLAFVAIVASDCPWRVPRFPYSPCLNASLNAKCTVECDRYTDAPAVTFELFCNGTHWKPLNVPMSNVTCSKAFALINANDDPQKLIFNNIGVKRFPAGLSDAPTIFFRSPVSYNLTYRYFNDLPKLDRLEIFNGTFLSPASVLEANSKLSYLTLLTTDRASVEQLNPLPRCQNVNKLMLPLPILNMSELMELYPKLQYLRTHAGNGNANIITYPPVEPVIPVESIYVDEPFDLFELRVALTSWNLSTELWKDSRSRATKLSIRSLEHVDGMLSSHYFPSNGEMERFEIGTIGIKYFDLDLPYAALKLTENVKDQEGNFNGFNLQSNTGVVCQRNVNPDLPLDSYVHCQCVDPPFRNAPHCPQTIPWQCKQNGTLGPLDNTQLCDNKINCDDGSDESNCYLQMVRSSVPSDNLGCYLSDAHNLTKGLIYAPGDGSCSSMSAVVRSHRSVEGALLDATFRMFVDDGNCGYVLWRLKNTNRSGFYTAHRAEFRGFLFSKRFDDCPELTPDELRERYNALYAVRDEETTQGPSPSKSPSRVGIAIAAGVAAVLVLLLIMAVVIKLRKSKQVGDGSYQRLEHFLSTANELLDEFLVGTALQKSLPLPLFHANDVKTQQRLGNGHFGTVWRAVLTDSQACDDEGSIALKIISLDTESKQCDNTSSVATGALMEALLHHRLQHSHIVRCYGVVNLSGGLGLALELAPQGDLRSFVRQQWQRISNQQQLLWTNQLASAVAYLHANRVLHRDLTLRNVLLKTQQHVLLADFGLSRFATQSSAYYSTNTEVELPFRWMAPESLLRSKYSPASDVWSLGVVLWELLHQGQAPYADKTLLQVQSAHQRRAGSLVFATSNSRVSELAEACMHYDVSSRPLASAIVQACDISDNQEVLFVSGMSILSACMTCDDSRCQVQQQL
eukprot:m.249979 g.249979  ORF g.249979 m.249979 type:complete len:916 (+) comp17516_c1_seq12:4205-6952(+)